MLAALHVPALRTLMCVRRLREPDGVVVVADFFNATLQMRFMGFYFCWLTQPAEHLPSDALDSDYSFT